MAGHKPCFFAHNLQYSPHTVSPIAPQNPKTIFIHDAGRNFLTQFSEAYYKINWTLRIDKESTRLTYLPTLTCSQSWPDVTMIVTA
jgi:hypothetical protein